MRTDWLTLERIHHFQPVQPIIVKGDPALLHLSSEQMALHAEQPGGGALVVAGPLERGAGYNSSRSHRRFRLADRLSKMDVLTHKENRLKLGQAIC